jgi:hypothetical protein
MHFYGMQPSEYAALDANQRHALFLDIKRIRARERLEFVSDVGSLMAEDRRAAQEYLSGLAHAAYPFDDENDKLGVILEAITR